MRSSRLEVSQLLLDGAEVEDEEEEAEASSLFSPPSLPPPSSPVALALGQGRPRPEPPAPPAMPIWMLPPPLRDRELRVRGGVDAAERERWQRADDDDNGDGDDGIIIIDFASMTTPRVLLLCFRARLDGASNDEARSAPDIAKLDLEAWRARLAAGDGLDFLVKLVSFFYLSLLF